MIMSKKLLCVLFSIQLIALSIYSVSVFNIANINNQTINGTAEISVASVGDKRVNDYDRDYLLNYLSERGIYVARHLYNNQYNLSLYTSNPTIKYSLPTKGRVQTTLSQHPIVSAIESLIFDTYPRINISVFDIYDSPQIPIEGIYYISLTDINVLNNLLEELNHIGIPVSVIDIYDYPAYIYFLEIAFAFLIEFAPLHIFLFLCIFISLVQYAISRLRYITLLLVHGHNNLRILKKIAINILNLFLIPFLVSVIFFFFYGLFVIGYSINYLFLLFLFFAVACFFLINVYIGIIYIVIVVFLRNASVNSILKGRKIYLFVQACNYLLRLIFLIFIFATLNPLITNIRIANERISMQSTWDMASHIYKVNYSGVGQFDRLDIEFSMLKDLVQLHEYLSESHNAFIMNSMNYRSREFFNGLEYNDHLSEHLLPLSVTVSPNYLKFNPISSIDGTPAEDKIITDDFTLNLLVPASFMPHHDFIVNEFLNQFYFSKIEVDNIYNRDLGLKLNTTSIEELNVNIIYVKDNQEYFTFNTEMVLKENIIISDPIAIVYTGSVHSSFLLSSFTSSYFIYSELNNPYDELIPVLEKFNHLHVVPRFLSVYNENASVILKLIRVYLTNIVFISLLALMNIIITYTLFLSYFEKNRYKLYVKSLFGFGFWRRNNRFMVNTFLYNAIITIALVIMKNILVVPLLLCFFIIEIMTYFFIDRVKMYEPFSNVIKGEH